MGLHAFFIIFPYVRAGGWVCLHVCMRASAVVPETKGWRVPSWVPEQDQESGIARSAEEHSEENVHEDQEGPRKWNLECTP